MRHHTNDPAIRAAAIADREADRICSALYDYSQYFEIWFETYQQTLRELSFHITANVER